jgi:replicative DNA helicase
MIPTDVEAEDAVIGCVVASAIGATLAHERLVEDDFHDRTYRRIFRASVDPRVERATDGYRPNSLDGVEARIEAVAQLTDLSTYTIAELEAERPVCVDASGSFAKRVHRAAARRRVLLLEHELRNTELLADKASLLAELTEAVANVH